MKAKRSGAFEELFGLKLSVNGTVAAIEAAANPDWMNCRRVTGLMVFLQSAAPLPGMGRHDFMT
jgi:hypothetical protein